MQKSIIEQSSLTNTACNMYTDYFNCIKFLQIKICLKKLSQIL